MKKYIGLWSFIFALLVVPAIAFANPTDVKIIEEQIKWLKLSVLT